MSNARTLASLIDGSNIVVTKVQAICNAVFTKDVIQAYQDYLVAEVAA